MAIIKTEKEIETLREGGRRLAFVLNRVSSAAKPGVDAAELEDLARRLIKESGDRPSFLGYKGRGDRRPFPAALCVSVNDELVHGVPNRRAKILRSGDIAGLDLGLIHEGFYLDAAVTVAVGSADETARRLVKVTKEALLTGIRAARPGGRVGDISFAIESFVKPTGFGVVTALAGHGVGRAVHEEPLVPNYGKKGTGPELLRGMVLAIEPMITEGSPEVVLDTDGFTWRTKDGKRSAHFEHTILIAEGRVEILTTV